MIPAISAIVLSIISLAALSSFIVLNDNWEAAKDTREKEEVAQEVTLDKDTSPSSIEIIGEQSGTQISASGLKINSSHLSRAFLPESGLDAVEINSYSNHAALLSYQYAQSRTNGHGNGIRAPTLT